MNSQAKIEAGASLLAALPIACVIVAPLRGDHGRVIDCTIVSVNAVAAEFLGHAPEALEGRRVRALCPRLAAEAEFRRLAAVIEACRPARFDAISDIGPHRALDVRAAPFESGAVVVFAGSDEQVAPLAQRLELALETARIGVWELWPDEYRTTWSAEECAIMGVDPADVTGTPDDFRARVAAESVDLVDRAYATLANRDDYRNTCRIIRPDGGARWIRENARVLRRDAKGAPLHVLGVSQDITEEHSALLRAEQAERRLELAVEAGGVGVWDLWPAERKAMWSRVKCAVLGLDPRRYADRIVHLSELPVGGKDAFVEKMTHALREADEMRDIAPAFLPDGGQRWILAHARVMARGPDGAPLHILGVSQDVTEEKEAQLRVERAERRLRAAIEALPDAFALFDAEDRLVVCNQRYRDVYPLVGDAVTPGARFEDILREGLARGQFPNAVGREEAWLAKRLAAHQSGVEAVGQKLADGRWLRIVEGRTDNGDHVGFRVDITELKAAQQRAETAEARLTAALEAMPFGFVIYDPDGRLAMCNAQYRALSPEAAETMVEGVEYAEILRVGVARGEYPDLDCAPEDWIAEKLRRLRESGDHVERRSGDRWVRCIAAQSATGDHVGFRVDLTDLKRHERALEHARDEIAARERELQDFFDLSPDLLGVATTEGRFVKLNAAWTAVLGYPTTALIGRSFLDFVHPEDLEATRREAEKAAAGGRSTDFTNRYRHADGGWVWIEWRSAPGPDGLTHFAARDVSERMRAAARREARACQEAVLTETMALALKPTDGENFLRAALDLLIARTPWMRLDDQAAVFLDDATQEEARCLRLAVSRNLDPAIQSYCARVAFGACSCGRAAQTGEAQHVAAPGCGADAGSTEARGAYCVPILNDGALIGVLLVRLRKGDAHDPEALAYLKRVAGVLALGLNQRKLMDETQAARRRAEDALAELSTYQAALDAHAIISVTDTEGVITAVNQRFCEITGYSEAELLGQTHRIVNSGLHPRDHWEKVWRTIKSGAPWHGEVCSRARNGDLYWCDTTLIPVRDADGVIQRFVAIRFDVTDRRRLARELEEINAQLREVAEISGVGGWSLDLKTYTMRWDAITRAINEVPEDYAPEPMSALHFAAPEARPKMQAAARACFEQGEPFDMELPVITAKGREIWVRSGARPVFEDGRVVRIDGVVQDITERKLREIETARLRARFETIFENSNSLISLRTRDNRVVAANRKMLQAFGKTGFDPQTDPDYAPEDVRALLAQAAARIFSTGQPEQVEETFPDPFGDTRTFLVSRSLIADPITGEDLMCSIATDITAQKALQASLEESRREAENANAAKSRFLATMSHEIRTPMNGVIGMAALLQDQLDDPKLARMVAVIRESGEALMTLLNDILDFSKIEVGKLTLETAPFEPETLARRVADVHMLKAREKGLEFRLTVAEAAKGARLGDAHRVQQMLHNLLSNAIKFTDAGEIAIEIDAVAPEGAPEDAGANALRIAVADTGIGMSAEQAARVFDEFTQADASTTRKFGGTGLGLSIVKGLCEAMGGALTLRTAPGEGARFEITLPLPPAQQAAPPSDAEQAAARLPPGLRVLAADDSEVNRIVLVAMLDALGVACEVAPGGRDAVERSRAGGYDLLMLDISMPDLDGVETLAEIRRLEAERGAAPAPAIAVTAHALKAQGEAFMEAGFQAHLAKPLRRAELTAQLRALAPARPPEAGAQPCG